MPSQPSPKYAALKNFRVRGQAFTAGDPVVGVSVDDLAFLEKHAFIGKATKSTNPTPADEAPNNKEAD